MLVYFEDWEGAGSESPSAVTPDDVSAEPFGLTMERRRLWERTVFAVHPSPGECGCGFFLPKEWFDEADKPDKADVAAAVRLRGALRAFIECRLERPGVTPCLVLAWGGRLEDISLASEGVPLALSDLESIFDMNGPNGFYRINV